MHAETKDVLLEADGFQLTVAELASRTGRSLSDVAATVSHLVACDWMRRSGAGVDAVYSLTPLGARSAQSIAGRVA